MACLTFNDAHKLATANRPWTFRMEFKGVNAATQSGWSEKFWLATGRGVNEPVEIHFGAIGTSGTLIVKDWPYVAATVPQKEAKGYVYADTPFVRVRQATIDAFSKATSAPPAAPTPVLPAPAQTWKHPDGVVVRTVAGTTEVIFDKFPKPWTDYHKFKGLLAQAACCPVVWADTERFEVRGGTLTVFADVCTFIQNAAAQATSPPTQPPAPPSLNTGLTGPYARITTVAPPQAGSAAWTARDNTGRTLLTLTAQGARSLVLSYPHITVAGL